MNLRKMKKEKFRKVEGELTDAIVENLTDTLDLCLDYINLNPYSSQLNEGEMAFFNQIIHLRFYDEAIANSYSETYNGIQLKKMSPEQIFSEGMQKLIFSREFCQIYNSASLEETVNGASKYFIESLYNQLSFEKYFPGLSLSDQNYLKVVQATHLKNPMNAGVFASNYNALQMNIHKRCKSSRKLKQIEYIGSKYGYGICLI